ncbi:DUF2860 domain-containing protein [Photobacterium sp. SDRW27]|uniref:DUF2860 domain-containing protein n=1 Tax=Photobacterium obscurum TaxID=2829490 RepID=UPI0022445933|nr:DUF2860 domain-containing protein [Photobacterium obscurum]MCW8327783.1 DUF2860 domain-containing protein [Photobacterium obscurum]
MNLFKLCLLTCVVSSTAQAAPNIGWTPGLGGDISLLTGYTKTSSQFNTDNDVTTDLNKSGDSESKFIASPLGTISYTSDQADKQIYFGTSRSDVALGRFHVELGYRQRLPEKGMLSISYVPGLMSSSTWEDPLAVNQKREETDSKIKGLRLQYDRILGSNFSIELSGGKLDIEDEKSGQQQFTPEDQALLKREGNILFSQLSYFKPINRDQILRSAISYTRLNADGGAMANDTYGAELGVIQRLPSSSLALTLSYDIAEFDETNPVFDQRQKDNRWGVFLAYEYRKPFGWENWGLVSLAGYNESNSNINFYDEDSLLISAGINYKF